MINEIFQIGTSEELGTISGFRLGRLPTTDVKWEEINAAMGQAVYLLAVLAHRFNYKFERYDIALCGAYTKISLKKPLNSQSKQTKYELFMPSNEERYNQGLVFLLDSLKSLTNYVESNYGSLVQKMFAAKEYMNIKNQTCRLDINSDLIGKQSIKYNSNNLPQWTKACKYFLTKLQYLVLMSVLFD
jgi:beclin 1